jgi:hypothetical protein
MEWSDYSESPLLYLPPFFFPSAITGWQRLAQHWICLKTIKPRWRSFNQSFYALALMTIFGKKGMQGTSLSFPLVLESSQSPLLPY